MSRSAQLASFLILCPPRLASSGEVFLLALPSPSRKRLSVHGPLIRDDSQIPSRPRAYVPFSPLFRSTHGSCRGLVLRTPRIILCNLGNSFFYGSEQRPRFPTEYALGAVGRTWR